MTEDDGAVDISVRLNGTTAREDIIVCVMARSTGSGAMDASGRLYTQSDWVSMRTQPTSVPLLSLLMLSCTLTYSCHPLLSHW